MALCPWPQQRGRAAYCEGRQRSRAAFADSLGVFGDIDGVGFFLAAWTLQRHLERFGAAWRQRIYLDELWASGGYLSFNSGVHGWRDRTGEQPQDVGNFIDHAFVERANYIGQLIWPIVFCGGIVAVHISAFHHDANFWRRARRKRDRKPASFIFGGDGDGFHRHRAECF